MDTEAKSYEEQTEAVRTNFSEKEYKLWNTNFYILLAILFIPIVLLIAVSI